MRLSLLLTMILISTLSCRENKLQTSNSDVFIDSVLINNNVVESGGNIDEVDFSIVNIKIVFSSPVDTSKFVKNKLFFSQNIDTSYNHRFSTDSEVLFIETVRMNPLTLYRFNFDVGPNLGVFFRDGYRFSFVTQLDTTPKFDIIPDDSLLSLVQEKTLEYFIDYAHPVSGMARERLGSGDIVASGGTGFGLMAIITGIERKFISRQDGFDHLSKIVSFLYDAEKFHGAFPHWINGISGKVYPFSSRDNGGDLVETAFLMQGLLTVREYFKTGNESEKALCSTIDTLWRNVEWDWYRNNDQNKLFWHWSPAYNWYINMPVSGWNEALIVYVLAASSPTHSIPREVYEEGWARNGSYPMKNGEAFYGINLPLGEDYGGPLYYAHHSFLGIDPRKLTDQYANYWEQNVAHSKINYLYCVDNPRKRKGYGPDVWGLTSSDIPNGYSASSPLNDLGVIAPTGAISSMPYSPRESMRALKYYYYVLGDRLWGEYGFKDAFSLTNIWFAESYLAVNQGPQVCMIENFRTGLLWNLFMGAEEVRSGMKKLGFNF